VLISFVRICGPDLKVRSFATARLLFLVEKRFLLQRVEARRTGPDRRRHRRFCPDSWPIRGRFGTELSPIERGFDEDSGIENE
jgi:hypothetical protein